MNILNRWIKRGLVRFKDALRYSSISTKLLLEAVLIQSIFAKSESRRLDLLMRAYRLSYDSPKRIPIYKKIKPYLKGRLGGIWKNERIGWAKYSQFLKDSRIKEGQFIIVKAPHKNGEKGVILIVGEDNWLRLLAFVNDMRYLDENFYLICLTSWSPLDYAILAFSLNSISDTIFIETSNYEEIPYIEEFDPRLKCLPFIISDWVNPDFYKPKPFKERSIDIVMVANFAPYKRHWQFFDALRRMPRSLRITLIGQTERGYSLARLRDLAVLFGVKQEIDFKENITTEELIECQCNSRISLIMSLREGSCVAAIESLFANTPLGLMHNAHVGAKACINKQTGVLLRPQRLDYQIMRFLDSAENYQPRAWAMDNISCFKTIEKFNNSLKSYAYLNGLLWTTGLKSIYLRCLRLSYVNPQDAEELLPIYEDLHNRFPDVF